MSFNYLEVARAAEIISADLPATVQGVELVEFALPGPLPDLNIGLRLQGKRLLVFSLRNPWTGLLYTAPGAFKTSRQSWARAFDGAQDWNVCLRGHILESVTAVEGDRVVRLKFQSGHEVEVELFPSRPNWKLVVGEQEFRWRKVLEAKAGSGAGTEPVTGTGNRTPVPVPNPAPLTASREPLADPETAAVSARLAPLIARRKAQQSKPVVLREFDDKPGRDWMARAHQHYLEARQDALLTSQVSRAQTQLQSRIAQLIKVRGQMMGALAESRKADDVRVRGERLKALLGSFPQGHRAERVEDIALDPQLSLAENSNKYFEKYKKLQRTKKEVEARLIGIEEASKKLSSTTAKLRGFKRKSDETFDAAYKRLTEQLAEAGLPVSGDKAVPDKLKKAEKKWQAAGVRKFQSKEGLALWAGRNHAENEELVIRLARGNDMWMHLKGRPGAHVVIQLAGGKTPSLETLLDGATLVAYYSGIKSNDKVEVDYTYRKYVKRVPGNKDKFLVTYTQNKTLMVKLEEDRLWRLLKQHSF